ncbi:MAG: acetate--CoA ligase family protein [Chloroflexi bacterium]|nr:acetate--CoA ligase family protein [Chloroflexota bacterium]MDA1147050.1 acetate--CoA ligase family protein [Chloroflexota bacterium]
MNEVIAAARARGRSQLTEVEAGQLLSAAGVSVAETRLATTADEAVAAAEALGFPLVMKVVSPDIAHKSDIGGVVVGVKDAAGVRATFEQINTAVKAAAPKATIDGIAVQAMAPPGTEVIIGATTDPQFGPVMMFGLGGVFVEVMKDVAFRIVPLEPRDAHQLIREIKGFPLLQGARGTKPADLDALEALILKVSAVVEANPEIAELDLNPIFASPTGAMAADAHIVLAEA